MIKFVNYQTLRNRDWQKLKKDEKYNGLEIVRGIIAVQGTWI